ncbi:hypothetical protein [Frateuria sp. STR12]|uniref:hypothetical protein n=1 Tax=Frateuria hangzhouensis TaxID=2995589 RepID=UPI002260F292|nr:hypothetical protein [Frateuria sp. STR12]MCX7512769.1 hypothetical protein [Frateuria sp. STR12]
MKLPFHPSVAVLCGVLAVAGCNSPDQAAQAPAASAQDDAAARKLDTYRQLLRIHNDEMSVTMGHDILDRYPGSAAAKEVQQTLPQIEKRWKTESEKRRLDALWLYQVSPMQGGTQSTATIYSSQPGGNDRVRLVLRRHTDWGQNVFLYGGGHGFVCRGNCTIHATFDGKAHGIKAFAPSTGEPALMIRDDDDFIARMKEARKITMDVTLVDGEKKQTLVYEVAGFDPAKWKGLPKK